MRELPLTLDADGKLSHAQAEVISDFVLDCEEDRTKNPDWGVPDAGAIADRVSDLARIGCRAGKHVGKPQVAVLIAKNAPPWFVVTTRLSREAEQERR